MFHTHPVFVQPDNEMVKVWRYMDFTKLVSLIDSRRLYFTRADKFGDPFEGSWPRINVAARQKAVASAPSNARNLVAKAMTYKGQINKMWPKYHAINCWHMNDHESAAMWRLYLKSDEGIAIQSSYKRLRESIIDDEAVYLGIVKYIDYENEWIEIFNNALSPFVHKRKSFEHEREVRALVTKLPIGDTGIDFTQETINHGIKIKVDMQVLIEKIYIAPMAPNWLADLVTALLHRYGYDFEVVQSKLNERPLF